MSQKLMRYEVIKNRNRNNKFIQRTVTESNALKRRVVNSRVVGGVAQWQNAGL